MPPPGRGGSPSALRPEAHNKHHFLGLHASIITVVVVDNPYDVVCKQPFDVMLLNGDSYRQHQFAEAWFFSLFSLYLFMFLLGTKYWSKKGQKKSWRRPTTEAQMNMMSGSGSTEVPARHRGSIGAAAAGSGSGSSSAFSPVADAQAAPSPRSSTRRRVLPGRPSKSNRGTSPIFLFTSLPFVFSC